MLPLAPESVTRTPCQGVPEASVRWMPNPVVALHLPDRGQATTHVPRAHVATPGPVGNNDANSACGHDVDEPGTTWAA